MARLKLPHAEYEIGQPFRLAHAAMGKGPGDEVELTKELAALVERYPLMDYNHPTQVTARAASVERAKSVAEANRQLQEFSATEIGADLIPKRPKRTPETVAVAAQPNDAPISSSIHGVGTSTIKALEVAGIRTLADLQAADLSTIKLPPRGKSGLMKWLKENRG